MSLTRENSFDEDDDYGMSSVGFRHFASLERFRLPTSLDMPSDENPATLALITPPKTNTNTSASSESSSHKQDTSEEMQREETLATVASQAEKNDKDAAKLFDERREQKASQFHAIHNNYTKRRYQHVESKVGQFIASIKAEERKRRAAKFQRHRSMPTNLTAQQPMQQSHVNSEIKGFSTNDLYKLHRETTTTPTVCYMDQHDGGMTCSTYSNSTQGGGASSSTSGAISNCTSRHESGDEAVICGADFIDKETYAQLVAEKEQLFAEKAQLMLEKAELETRLDEKFQECVLKKRDVDFIRIELMNCQDELQRIKANDRLINLRKRTALLGYSSDYPYGGTSCFSMDKLPQPDVATKGTQTEYFSSTSSGLLTPKRASTASENILRQRANSNSSMNQQLQIPTRRNCNFDEGNLITYKEIATTPTPPPDTRTSIDPSLSLSNSEYTYYDRRYAPVPTMCDDDSPNRASFYSKIARNAENNQSQQQQQRQSRRTSSLRQRIARLFGRCTRCEDPNQSFDAYGNSYIGNNIEMMRSPMPMLADFH